MTRRAAHASDEPAFCVTVQRAAARFRASGRHAYFFSRGKLRGDPVFAALLRDGHIASRARIVDLGCGLGVLPALLAAAEEQAASWPAHWAPAPSNWTLHGFDLRHSAIDVGRRALSDLGQRVQLAVSDMRTAPLPASDVVVMLDVLHYIDSTSQQALLARVHSALAPGGSLLLRVADAAPTWRFRATWAVDWSVSFARNCRWPRLEFRPLAEWIGLLKSIGFMVTAQPMSNGTPFANVLLVAGKR